MEDQRSAVNGSGLDLAVLHGNTNTEMRRQNLDPAAYLANNDATGFFAMTGDLLLTGPTLTNVNDVRVILVDRAS